MILASMIISPSFGEGSEVSASEFFLLLHQPCGIQHSRGWAGGHFLSAPFTRGFCCVLLPAAAVHPRGQVPCGKTPWSRVPGRICRCMFAMPSGGIAVWHREIHQPTNSGRKQ